MLGRGVSKRMIVNLLLVGAGGFTGAISRFAMTKKMNTYAPNFPIGTLIVNLLGSLLLGVIAGMKANEMIVLLFGVGFLGAFTTFSTLKFELNDMYLKKNKWKFFIYIMLTYGLGILLGFLGYLIGVMFV